MKPQHSETVPANLQIDVFEQIFQSNVFQYGLVLQGNEEKKLFDISRGKSPPTTLSVCFSSNRYRVPFENVPFPVESRDQMGSDFFEIDL